MLEVDGGLAAANRLKDEMRIKEETAELYDRVLNNQFDDVTLRQIDDFIANVTPDNPYRRPLSKRLPPRVGQALRGIERNNAVDALFTRISESAVRETGSSMERARAHREVEKKKKELLREWAIATGSTFMRLHYKKISKMKASRPALKRTFIRETLQIY